MRSHPGSFKFRLSLGIIGAVILLMLLGPLLGPDPYAIHPLQTLHPPSMHYWFGTDELGRDLFSRLAVGARISLFIGAATAVVSVCIGTAIGTLAAQYQNRWPDTLILRVIDIIYSLPGLMIVILLTLFIGRSLWSLVLALALFSWPDTARLIRGQVLSLKREEYVEAFHSLGGNAWRLVLYHYLPNLASLILLTATITIPRAILTESTLSFVGLGVSPPFSSWGTMINDGWQMIRLAPYLVILPAGLLFLTMIALNLLSDALKENTINSH